MWRIVLLVLLLAAVWYFVAGPPSAPAPSASGGPALPLPALLAPDEPVQTALNPGENAPWMAQGDTITPLARYDVKARIMHREPYRFDHWSSLSPVDFALGWEKMAESGIYGALDIEQHGRWYFYHWSGYPPLPPDQIISESANTHILPANAAIRDRVMSFEADDLVELEGFLVRVDSPDHHYWVSSLSRTDTGDGSCEVLWVEQAVLRRE